MLFFSQHLRFSVWFARVALWVCPFFLLL
jgi:hypothetical protein